MQGFAQRRQLGLSRRELASALRSGRLIRVGQGWYASPDADPDVTRALRLGTRLTCLSAVRLHGLWVPHNAGVALHVALRHGDPGLVKPGVVTHRLPSGWPSVEPLVDLEMCLDHVLRHHSVETGLMVLESAVDRGLITVASASALIAAQPQRKRLGGLHHFDPRSGSGSETRVRLWFQRRNVRVRSQVSIAGVGRVDLLVGESLVIEVDSRAHHTGEIGYREDRRRDLALYALGFDRLRLTWEQVFLEWPASVRLLKEGLVRSRYRRPPADDAVLGIPNLPWAA